MSKYRITGPDGGTYEITAPDGATEQDVLSYVQGQHKTTSAEVPAVQPMPEGPGKFAPPKAPGLSLPEPGMLEDALKSGAAGLARGAIGLAGLPGTVEQLGRMGINYAGRKLSGNDQQLVSEQPVLPSAAGIQKQVEENVTGKLYKPQTAVGRYTNAIGEFAPGMLFPGSMAQRVMGNVVGPAVVSETAGHAAKDTVWEAPARIAGAIAGGFVPNLPIKAYTPVATGAERQAAVQTLRSEGVKSLSAGEVTGSKPLRYLEQHAGDIPGSGAKAATMADKAASEFTAAALKRAGITAERATPDVMDNAFSLMGREFDQLGNAAKPRLTPKDWNDIASSVQKYESRTAPNSQVPAVRKWAEDVADFLTKSRGGPMPGQQYAKWRSDMEDAARAIKGKDPEAADAIRQIRNVLDDAAERSLPPQMRNQYADLRNRYRNILVIERAAGAAGEKAAEGLISPAQLANATKQLHGKRAYVRGNGDFAELARAGVNVMSPLPNSGTPARLAAGAVGQAIGAGAGLMAGGAPGAAAGAVLGPVAQAMLARAFMSGPMQRYLGANARMQPAQMNSMQGGLIGGGMAGATSPLEVSIFPSGDPRNNL